MKNYPVTENHLSQMTDVGEIDSKSPRDAGSLYDPLHFQLTKAKCSTMCLNDNTVAQFNLLNEDHVKLHHD